MAIRLGDIGFLNSWPVTYALRQGLVPAADVRVVSGTPAELNRRLLTGELDASCVSSAVYLRHPEEFVPIPGLCVRSDSGVHSVLLVSRTPLSELKGKTIGVTNQATTTPILLKVLLLREGLKLTQEVTSLRFPKILQEYPAALLIGDEALQVSQESDDWITWDLAQEWANWTRLPFVFALWVVRRRLIEENPRLFTELGHVLHTSYEWGKGHSRELMIQMRRTFPFEANFLKSYLSALSYELDSKAWSGLRRFAREAQKLGELPKAGVAIKPVPAPSRRLLRPPRGLALTGEGSRVSSP